MKCTLLAAARKRWFFLSLALALSLGAAGQATANLITNGSFESPVLTPGTTEDVAGGNSSTIPGWITVGNDVLLVQTTYSEPANGMTAFNAADGLNSLDVTGAGNTGFSDGVQQTVTTVPGQSYLLSFDLGEAQSNNGSPLYGTMSFPAIDVSVNGFGPGYGGGSIVPGFVGWVEKDYRFTATSTSTTIKLTNGTSPPTDFAGLDNVVLNAVPEPSSIMLLSLGALALAAIGRRKLRSRTA